MSKNSNIQEAKLSIKSHIKFFESLLKHISGNDQELRGRSMWASWCLHRYINDKLIIDIEQAMKEYSDKPN